jgi:salicylate hydroxylase
MYSTRISQQSSNTDAGMGGLATALALAKQGFTQIDVYEAASNLGFVGAGIQLAPNMARILDRLGVWKDIEAEAVDLKETFIRRQSATVFRKPQSSM